MWKAISFIASRFRCCIRKMFARRSFERRSYFVNDWRRVALLTPPPFNFQVYSADLQYFKTIEGRTASKITMRLHLQSVHFGGGPVMSGGGQLILRCTAQIGNLYQEYTEKELGVPQKDPIPARGKVRQRKYFGDSQKLIKTFRCYLHKQLPRQLPWIQQHLCFLHFSQPSSHWHTSV